MKSKFLLLLGVSGAGKSTLIKLLLGLEPRFKYIRPYTNRPLRENEVDKIYISPSKMEKMVSGGDYLFKNEMFGYTYLTPKEEIYWCLTNEHFPILDWPVHHLSKMREVFADDLFCTYVLPESIATLKRQLDDGRDADGKRYKEAVIEIDSINNSMEMFDLVVTNKHNQSNIAADTILSAFRNAIHAS